MQHLTTGTGRRRVDKSAGIGLMPLNSCVALMLRRLAYTARLRYLLVANHLLLRGRFVWITDEGSPTRGIRSGDRMSGRLPAAGERPPPFGDGEGKSGSILQEAAQGSAAAGV
jgi:hypothetical protein